MPRIVRDAEVTWNGSLARGGGEITAGTSGAFTALPYSLPARIGNPEGRTSPEELLAAAHGGCFAMSLANELGSAGATVEQVQVWCRITMDEVEGKGHQIVHSAISASARGDGMDGDTLDRAIAAADAGCSFSVMLRSSGAAVETSTTGVRDGD